jgi:hypothetical protein
MFRPIIGSSSSPSKNTDPLYGASAIEGSQIALALYKGSVFFEGPENDPMMGQNM